MILDTSFLIAFFDADDARHAKVRGTFAATTSAILGPEALVETLGVLKAKAGRKTADRALQDLMRLSNIEWGEEVDVPGTYRIYRKHRSLSYVDAAVIQLALRKGMPILTLDARQAAVHKAESEK